MRLNLSARRYSSTCEGCNLPSAAQLCRLFFRGERAREPVQALVQAVARGGASTLDEPLSAAEIMQAQLLCHLRRGHRVRQVLLVGEDKHHGISHLILIQHLVQLLTGVLDAVTVVAVNHIDQAVGALVVVAPQRPDLVLAAHVPDREAQVLVLHRLDVEADGRDGRHHLAQLQLVQDRGLTSCVQTDHEDAHLRFSDHSLPYLREGQPHGACCLRR
mmetsp:Transcript_6955/g.19728  ORF Transcript_6955/g.19728 Transcript_6955/m.19728 type:complete len:217 (-) Transcript_6955:40-690(-)